MQNITQRYNKNGCWTASSSKLQVGSYVKPGGTGILALERSNVTVLDRGEDPWNMGSQMEVLFWLDSNKRWTHNVPTALFAHCFGFLNINSEMDLPATYPNIADPWRSTRIDFGICTRKVLENMTYVGATPNNLDTLGDHRGVLVDINMASLLGTNRVKEEIKTRKLVMLDKKNCPNISPNSRR